MTDRPTVCANHPLRETALRCNRCGKPICAKCAVHTPVGYRCRECVHGQQKEYDTVRQIDYLIAGVISALGLGAAMFLLGFLSWWGFFIAPVLGGGLADIVRWAIGRRRGRHLPLAAVIGGAVGISLFIWQPFYRLLLLFTLDNLGILGLTLLQALVPIIIGGLMLSTLYYRLRGIRL